MTSSQTTEQIWKNFTENPNNREDFVLLQEHYQKELDEEKLAELFSLHASAFEEKHPSYAATLYGTSGLHWQKIGRREKSFQVYQKAYHLERATHRDVFFQTCMSLGKWEKLISLWWYESENTSDAKEKADWLYKIALAYRDKLENRAKAKEFLKKTVEEDINPDYVKSLERVYLEDEEYEALLELYDLELKLDLTPETRIEKLRQMNAICEKIPDEKKNIQYAQQLLQILPQDEHTLSSLEKLYQNSQEWDKLVGILRVRFEEEDSQEQAVLLQRIALIYKEKLEQIKETVECYEELWALNSDPVALEELVLLYEKNEDWNALAETYQRQISLSSSPKKINLLLAELFQDKIKNKALAIQHYRAALAQDSLDHDLILNLQKLYIDSGDDNNLLECYYLEIETLKNKQSKLLIYDKIIQILVKDERWEEASLVYEKVWFENPEQEKYFHPLKEIYEKIDEYDKLAQLLAKKSEMTSKVEEKKILYRELAELYHKKLDNEDQAMIYYEMLLELDPRQVKVWEVLRNYFREQEEGARTIEATLQIIRLEPKQRSRGYWEIAQIYQKLEKDWEQACQYYYKLLELRPGFENALSELQSIYLDQKMWDKYIDVSKQLAAQKNNPAERIAILFSVYETYEKENNQTEQEKVLLSILEANPIEKKALTLLKELYEKEQKWSEYIAIEKREALSLDYNSGQLIEKYQKIAQCYVHKLGDITGALPWYEKISFFQPDNFENQRTLELFYTQTENFLPLIQTLESRSHTASEPAEKNNYLYMAGMLCEEKLQDPIRAISFYELITARDPGHLNSLQRLRKLYKKHGPKEPLKQVFRHLCALSVENPHKLMAFHLEAASEMVEPIWHYERVLEIDPEHTLSLDSLEKLYQENQTWDKLAGVYTLKESLAQDTPAKINCLFELATLYQDKLEQAEKSVLCYERVLSMNPEHTIAIEKLEDLYRQREDWAALVRVLQSKTQVVEETDKKVEILAEMGSIYQNKLFSFYLAIQAYEKVITFTDFDLNVVQQLRNLYKKERKFSQVIRTIDDELAYSLEDEQTLLLLFEKADIFAKQMNEPDRAKDVWEQIIQKSPGNAEAYKQLAMHYEQMGDREKLLETFIEQFPYLGPKGKKNNLLRQAHILMDQEETLERATLVVKQGLEMDPEDSRLRTYLTQIYRQKEKWQELAELYQDEIDLTRDPEKKLEISYYLAQVWYEQLGKRDEPLAIFLRVLEAKPDHLGALRNLQQIFVDQENYFELMKLYEQELQIPNLDAKRRAWVQISLAQTQEEKLSEAGKATQNYLALLKEENPENLLALQGLQRISLQHNNMVELQDFLEQELAIQKNPQRIWHLHSQLAEIKEKKLPDVPGAIIHYEFLHQESPQDLVIIQSLIKLYQKKKNWESYTIMAEKGIPLLLSPVRVSKHYILMQIYHQKLKQPEKAIGHGKAALDLDPSHRPSILYLEKLYEETAEKSALAEMYEKELRLDSAFISSSRAVTLHLETGKIYQEKETLDLAVEHFRAVLSLDPQNKEVLARLAEIFQKEESWEKLIDVYEEAARMSKDEEESMQLYFEIGILWEQKGENLNKALENYVISYHKNPTDLLVVNKTRTLQEKLEKWSEAVEFLEIEVGLLEEDGQKAGTYRRIGEIWEDHLKVPTQAIIYYQKVLEFGFHRETSLRARRILEKLSRYEEWAQVLEKSIRHTTDNEKIEELCLLGKIYHKNLRNKEEALRVYRTILKLDSGQAEALEGVSLILEEQKNWDKLISILGRRLKIEEASEQRSSLYRKLGSIFYEELYQGKKALLSYEKALEIEPEHIPTIHTLQDIYEKWGQYNSLVAILEKEISLIEEQTRQVELYRALGFTWEFRLLDLDKAIKAFEALRQIIPQDLTTIQDLARLYQKQRYFPKLCDVLQEILKDARENANQTVELQVLLELGQVHYIHLKNKEEGSRIFQKILEIDSSHKEAFQALRKIYQEQEEYAALAFLLEARFSLEIANEQQELASFLGELYQERIPNPEKAIFYYEKAQAGTKDDSSSLGALEKLYREQEKWNELEKLYQEKIPLANSPENKAKIYAQLAELYQNELNDPKKSFESYQAASEEYPTEVSYTLKVAQVYQQKKQWTEACQNFEKALPYITDSQRKLATLTTMGDLFLDKIDDSQQAQKSYTEALEINPHHRNALEPLTQILFCEGKWTEVHPLYQVLLSLMGAEEENKQAELYYQWALVARALKESSNAITRLLKSIELDPSKSYVQKQAGDTYSEEEQWINACQHYKKAYELSDAEEQKTIEKPWAISLEKTEQFPEAISHYLKYLEQDPAEKLPFWETLGDLYQKTEKFPEAKEFYKKILASNATQEKRQEVWEKIAEVEEKAKDTNEAIEALLQGMRYPNKKLSIKKNLSRLYQKNNQWEEALSWMKECYADLTTDEERVENLIQRAEILPPEKSEQAIGYYEKALELVPTHLPCLEGLANLYKKHENWSTLAEKYTQFLSQFPEKESPLPLHLDLAHTQAEKLNDPHSAIAELKKALQIDPEHLGAQITLAELQSQLPETQEKAISTHLKVLLKSPFRKDSYEQLTQLLPEFDRHDQAHRAHRALNLLSLNPSSLPEQTNLSRSKVSTEVLWKSLIPRAILPIAELMAQTSEFMNKVYPTDLEQTYQIDKKSHLAAQSVQPPVWFYTNTLMTTLKINDLNMYTHHQEKNKIYLALTNHPCLILNQEVAEKFSEPELRFLLSKYLFYIAQKQTLALTLTTPQLQQYFQLLHSTIHESTPVPQDPETLALQKKIRGALPRKIKKQLETQEWPKIEEEEISKYQEYLNYASNRCALLLSDSLALSVQMLYFLETEEKWEGQGVLPEKVREVEGVRDLFLFNISETYTHLRRSFGWG